MTPVSVLAAGMVTAVGYNYRSSCAAIRAGVSGVKETNLWDFGNGAYVAGGRVDLPQWWEGIGKLAELAAPAIWECLTVAAPEPPENIPILLGVAGPDRPHRWERLEREILDEVEWRLNLPHHPESAVIAIGNVAGALAIQRAAEVLTRGFARRCVIAGVDSFLHQEMVNAYIAQRRIVTETNSNGFFPGEAGCAVLAAPDHLVTGPRLRITGLACGSGEASATSEDPSRGVLLTRLVREALSQAGLKFEDTFYRNTDLNGEHSGFKEASFVPSRIQRRRLPYLHQIWHPVEYLGEIGAASVPCALGLSLFSGQRNYATGPRGICHFASDSGDRAAMIVEYGAN
jgi:3-oxoacyl-[acyl-carrier-protein] synthase-1